MRFLVTGHKGFIGSNLVKKLKEDGHDFVGWDTKEDNKNIKFLKQEDFVNIDKVIHLAAFADVRASNMYPEEYYTNNVDYTRLIFNCALEAQIPVIYASSSCAYEWWKSGYGTTKKMCEIMGQSYGWNVGLRFTTVYGDNARPDMLISRMVSNRLNYVTEHIRDFVHVDDVCDAIKLFAYSDITESNIYDVGSGHGIDVRTLADEYGFGDVITKPGESSEMQSNIADITKITSLGWRPKRDLNKYLKGRINGDSNFKDNIKRLLSSKSRFWRY